MFILDTQTRRVNRKEFSFSQAFYLLREACDRLELKAPVKCSYRAEDRVIDYMNQTSVRHFAAS